MKYSISRPETTDLAVSLFARTLHPELFEPHECFEYRGGTYQATVQLTSRGHTVEFRRDEQFVTEVIDCKQALLPSIKRLCLYAIESNRSLNYQLEGGLKVDLCFECEYITPDIYNRIEQEYWKDAQSATLSHLDDSSGFNGSPGLSFIRIDPQEDALSVHGFHLYPEECAIVKSQSLFSFA
ncbi:MAG: DUF2617 family protein [Planctomycetaceae bacterium]|nr:DUF2617 family protein [Planctomycetaceae bacterium]